MGREALSNGRRLLNMCRFHPIHVHVSLERLYDFNTIGRVAMRRLDMHCAAAPRFLF